MLSMLTYVVIHVVRLDEYIFSVTHFRGDTSTYNMLLIEFGINVCYSQVSN